MRKYLTGTFTTLFSRRSMMESVITGSLTSEDEFQNMLRIVKWLPLCWHQVNRCLESSGAGDVTIGNVVIIQNFRFWTHPALAGSSAIRPRTLMHKLHSSIPSSVVIPQMACKYLPCVGVNFMFYVCP